MCKRRVELRSLVHEVEQELPVGRNVALVFVDASLDPGTMSELVCPRVPSDDVVPLRRTTSQNHRCRDVGGLNYKQMCHVSERYESPGTRVKVETFATRIRPIRRSG